MSTNGTSKPRDANGRFLPATNGKNRLANLSASEIRDALTRVGFAAQHGLQYGGKRDLNKVGGYIPVLRFKNYQAMYERDGIAGQIVDMPPETTWRHPPEIVERRPDGQKRKQGEKGTPFEEAWTQLVDRLGLWQRFERADRLSRIGSYGVILIGAAGTGDDASLRSPLTTVQRPEDVIYLSCYDEAQAQIKSWVVDGTNPRFGLPETYEIDRSSGVESFKPQGQVSGSTIVHYTRVIHVAEGLAADEVHGRPALQRIFNDLFDLQKVSVSTAEGFWQRVAGILTAEIDPEVTNASEVIPGLKEEMEAVFHEMRRAFVGQGVKLGRLAESEPNPTGAADLYMTRIAAGAGIPKRLLFGSETGERASSEDQKTYLGSIGERQKQHAEPQFVRAFVERLILIKALERPELGYDVVWPPLFEESELDVSEANNRTANAAKNLTPVGGDPTLLVEVDEERRLFLKERGPDEPSPFEEMLEEKKEMEREAMERALVPDEGGEKPAAA